MALTVITKLAMDLAVGDVVIGGIAHPPSLHYDDAGRAVLHHTQVIAVDDGRHAPEAYHPLWHLPDGAVREAVESGDHHLLEPVVDEREFPAVRVTLAGFENGEQHPTEGDDRQFPIERQVGLFEAVTVLEGDLRALYAEAS